MKSFDELHKSFREAYLSENSISEMAYWYWKKHDCWNGEEINKNLNMKNKDVDWWLATMALEMFAGFDAGTVEILLWEQEWHEKNRNNSQL
jgi:hypothetical protein